MLFISLLIHLGLGLPDNPQVLPIQDPVVYTTLHNYENVNFT